MAILTFTLSEEGVAAFHEALQCLNRFSDDVSLDARRDKLTLSTINISKTGSASISFTANRFFSRYSFNGGGRKWTDRFYCMLWSKALTAVFRSRASNDPSRNGERESTIERCDVSIFDEPGEVSRFVAAIVSRNGITTTFELPFEPRHPTYAKFDKDEAVHHWSISSRTLRKLVDHFHPTIELLDINSDGERVVNFGCFPEKGGNIEDALRKPLWTSIAVDVDEFDSLELEDKLHIIINVRDFRAIVAHAVAVAPEVEARYSLPNRPMQIAYNGDAIVCRFILMTVGEQQQQQPQQQRGASAAAGAKRSTTRKARAATTNGAAPGGGDDDADSAPNGAARARARARGGQKQQDALDTEAGSSRATPAAPRGDAEQQPPPPGSMLPPPVPSRTQQPQQQQQQQRGRQAAEDGPAYPFGIVPPRRPTPSAVQQEPASQSLFVESNDEYVWEPVHLEGDEEDEDDARLEWDASEDANPSATFNLSGFNSQRKPSDSRSDNPSSALPSGIEPTQPLTEAARERLAVEGGFPMEQVAKYGPLVSGRPTSDVRSSSRW